jgi:hypothetical protein
LFSSFSSSPYPSIPFSSSFPLPNFPTIISPFLICPHLSLHPISSNYRTIIFEIPSQERLEKFEAKAKAQKSRKKAKTDIEEDPKNLIAAQNTEKIIVENIRREKEAAVEMQLEEYPNLKDGEKVDEALYHSLLCTAYVEMLKKLICEIRATQIYVDNEGIVTKRTTAKTALRKVDRTS